MITVLVTEHGVEDIFGFPDCSWTIRSLYLEPLEHIEGTQRYSVEVFLRQSLYDRNGTIRKKPIIMASAISLSDIIFPAYRRTTIGYNRITENGRFILTLLAVLFIFSQ